ncbi:serine hydrolase domain-containing protein [Vannielia litorea]|uniref:serine hydrolase domain-containing protein n=1 Tax=Vannielia litorea TaxID=1217970 RepID=UPI001FD2D74E|nr:serine hydrolase domain-containing protein [Vannielia litorea]MBS8224858.1 class A beta-lactamase-related serine hydrolase [Vannielia litorea]
MEGLGGSRPSIYFGVRVDAAWVFEDGETGGAGDLGALWPWWSFSKTIIAGCALRLARGGRLDLDAEAGGPWSLRQLLQHRAGVPCYGRLPQYHAAVARGEVPWSRARLMAEVSDTADFSPGTGWAYSNVGYMLARERVEAAAGCGIGTLAARCFGEPLGLETMRLATEPEDFADVPGAEGYHPGWVYHGCFMGAPAEAARLVAVLVPELIGEGVHPLGGGIEGRPWTETGYGLGLMAGRAGALGRATGHAGVGPFSCCTVTRFPDAPRPVSVAVFAAGSDEAVPEWEAVRIAQNSPSTSPITVGPSTE